MRERVEEGVVGAHEFELNLTFWALQSVTIESSWSLRRWASLIAGSLACAAVQIVQARAAVSTGHGAGAGGKASGQGAR